MALGTSRLVGPAVPCGCAGLTLFLLLGTCVIVVNHDAVTTFGDNAFSTFGSILAGQVHRRGTATAKDVETFSYVL